MDFKEATDELGELGVTHAEIGEALGVAGSTIRAARLDTDSPNYRRPPDDWRPKLAELVEKRGGEFQDLARELREGAE